MTLRGSGDTIELTVIDDGAGFDPAVLDRRIAEGHIGLASLMARVGAMGGTFDIDTAPGSGTRVRITTPVSAK